LRRARDFSLAFLIQLAPTHIHITIKLNSEWEDKAEMANVAIDPAIGASIRVKQEYQEKLDAYHRAEERRLLRKANFGRQALIGMVAFVVVAVFFVFVLRDFQFPVWLYVLPFFAGTELFLIVAYLASLRPNAKPIAPAES
jgi:hypothetical protein